MNFPTREDWKILNAVYPTPVKRISNNVLYEVPDYVDALIRKMAETHSQHYIARTLNEKGIKRPDGLPWKQYFLSRYFKAHNIKPVCKWKGTYNKVWGNGK
jgi:hypothetical protein